jgi:hypothetical protein
MQFFSCPNLKLTVVFISAATSHLSALKADLAGNPCPTRPLRIIPHRKSAIMKTILLPKWNQTEPEPATTGSAKYRKSGFGRRAVFAFEALLILSLSLAPCRKAAGDLVSAEQARDAVNGWLRADHAPLQTAMGQPAKRVETFNDAQGSPLYYVVSLDPEGFVIVAADDLVEPIIGFASGGRFDPSTHNPLGALVSNDLPGRVAGVNRLPPATVAGPALAARNKWDRLKRLERTAAGVALGLPGVSDVRVPPLIQTLWDQNLAGENACYNYYTPPYSEGATSNYYCGCVATAMAQLMRFWQHPVNGVGTAAFTISVDDSAESRSLRGGDGAGGAYDWNDMVLDPASSSTFAQRQAIGALCADAGVSVNMNYNSYGSGADTLLAKDALISTFDYANATKGFNDGATIGEGLNGMINPNLDAGCPVLLGITGDPGGHAIVCDGYGYDLSTLYHHLNLCWSGVDTAWYSLPTIDTSPGTFTSVYKCVYNVWTNGTGEIISGRVTDGNGTPLAGVVVAATRAGGETYTVTNNGRGIYAFAPIPSSSTYTISASKTGYVFATRTNTTGLSTDFSANSGNQGAVDFVAWDNLGFTPATGLTASGYPGGPFTPSGQTYVLTNAGSSALNWTARQTGNWVDLSATSGALAAGGSTNVAATITANALPAGLYSNTITFSNATSGIGNRTREITLTVAAPIAYSFPLDNDPGWTRQGQWAFGHPTGQGGTSHGYPDPANGATGTNVFGVNLNGDYPTTTGGPYYLIAGPLDFTGYTNVILQFKRWFNSDYQPYVYATLDVSSNGITWTSFFVNGSSIITDSAWTNCRYNLSAIAANQADVYVRWGYRVVGGAWAYSGWNIDDIEFLRLPLHVPRLGIALSGTNLVLHCADGSPGGMYYVLASTNLMMPWTNWPVIATHSFDANGYHAFTNGLNPDTPQRFFRLRLP